MLSLSDGITSKKVRSVSYERLIEECLLLGIGAVRYQGMKPLTLSELLNSLDGVVSAEG